MWSDGAGGSRCRGGRCVSLALMLTALALCGCRVTGARPEGAFGKARAFPGAEGFGSQTPGGRGGRVIFVTNLEDSGPGSLRAACDAAGPRTVVFRVSGLISLNAPLVVKSPYLTIAGQTALGDGVCLRNYALVIATHDVIVRYLRSRPGDLGDPEADCITLADGARRVILDHCSATWSVDEALSLAGGVSDVTVQWCLIAEALNRSNHPKGAHGYGSLMRADGPVSLHHNLWAHNDSRNPRLGDDYGRAPYPTFDVRNNVIYDYGRIASGLTQGTFEVNYVANYIKPGPASAADRPILIGSPSNMIFHIQGNVLEGDERMTNDNTLFFSSAEVEGRRQLRVVGEPFPAAPVQTLPAADAYEAVLAGVGATLPARDAVDARIIGEVRLRGGRIIDSQEQVGGWPEYLSAQPPADSDDDGMPDAWEAARGLNPRDPADASLDRDGDGYTNVEEFINELTPRASPAQILF